MCKMYLSKRQPSLFTKGFPNPHLLFFRFLCFCPYYCFFFSFFFVFLLFSFLRIGFSLYFVFIIVFSLYFFIIVFLSRRQQRRSNKRLIILPPSFIFLYCGSFRRHPPNQRAKQCGKIQCGKFFCVCVENCSE